MRTRHAMVRWAETRCPQQGGLIGLAAATVGLAADHEMFLKARVSPCSTTLPGRSVTKLTRAAQKIVPPVLHSFIDQDSRVRYYACEALYNIAKARQRVCLRTRSGQQD